MNRRHNSDSQRSRGTGHAQPDRRVAPPPFVLDGITGPLPTLTTLEVLRRLVAFNSASEESNLELIFWCREFLQEHRVPCRLSFDAVGRKANLFATIGAARQPGLILAAHTDVVPVAGQSWISDPFVAVQRNGRIYGRGTADAKGFIAVCLAMVPHILDAGLDRPVHLALTYDEETSMSGVKRMLVDLRDHKVALPQGCILGCPTEMRPVIGHKGRTHWTIRVRGKEGHSAQAQHGPNAIEHAAALVVQIQAIAAEWLGREEADRAFDVPNSTVQTGVIRGGCRSNTVPASCEFDVELRHLPGSHPDQFEAEFRQHIEVDLLPRMRAQHPEVTVEVQRQLVLPPFSFAADGSAHHNSVATLLRCLAKQPELRTRCVSFGTEAYWYQREGIPTLLIGPGSIAQAHRPDEFIEMSQLAQCEGLLARVVAELGSVAAAAGSR